MEEDDNIVIFPKPFSVTYTTENIPTQNVIDGIQANNLETVVVMGYTKDGEEYFASSVADGGTILWLMERMKLRLLTMVDEYDD